MKLLLSYFYHNDYSVKNKNDKYLLYDIILHEKDANIVLTMIGIILMECKDWVVMALPQLMGTRMV